MRRSTPLFAVFLVVVTAAPPLDGTPAIAAQNDGLFSPAAATRGAAPDYSVRSRTAALTLDLETAESPLETTLDLFDDVSLPVTLERIAETRHGVSWRGSVPGVPGHAVVLTARSGIVWGSAALPQGRFTFEHAGDGLVRIVEVGGVPEMEAEPVEVPLPRRTVEPVTSGDERTGTTRIDVLVLYTAAIESELGGPAATAIYAQTRMAELTTIFGNSLIDAEAWLASAEKAADTESGRTTSDMLYALLCNGTDDLVLGYKPDGVTPACADFPGFDEAHTLRDSIGADLVTLLVKDEATAGGSSIAFRLVSQSGDDRIAFSVVNENQASSQYSMSHEIGHNLGSVHDHDNPSSGSPPVFDYAFGYRWPGEFSTVMSYYCDPSPPNPPGTNCSLERIPVFSNPNVDYDSPYTPTGPLPTGSAPPAADQAHNALAFTATTALVADYRTSTADLCNGVPATITGGPGDDVLTGTAGDDVIMGFEGNDTIDGLGGDDTICAGMGADRITGGFGADWIDGGGGQNDWVDYLAAPSGVTVDLAAGSASGGHGNDTVANVEHIKGSTHDDVLTGDPKANRIYGYQGIDVIDGRAGDDIVDGGPGNDTVRGHKGDDQIIGSYGRDTAEFSEATGPVTVDLEAGTGSYGGFNDTLSGIEHLRGSKWNDLLKGDDFDNVLRGIGGDDDLRGRAGFDYLLGGAGTDTGIAGMDGASCINIENPDGC